MPIIHSVSVSENDEFFLKETHASPTKVFQFGIMAYSYALLHNQTLQERIQVLCDILKEKEKENVIQQQ